MIKSFIKFTFYLVLASAWSSASASPWDISYSGKLTNIDGTPVEGPVDLEVRFFSVETGGAEKSGW